MTGYLLGHVLVHEITHVLQEVPRHSESGMMKARWEGADFARMRHQTLPFAEEDIRLIHAWSERHNRVLFVVVR
jgi:hypothetical protein